MDLALAIYVEIATTRKINSFDKWGQAIFLAWSFENVQAECRTTYSKVMHNLVILHYGLTWRIEKPLTRDTFYRDTSEKPNLG